MNDTLLIEIVSEAFTKPAQTTVTSRKIGDAERLVINQPRDASADEEDDDCIVLDKASQRALYLALKLRFEE
jgi:hypothetical protein